MYFHTDPLWHRVRVRVSAALILFVSVFVAGCGDTSQTDAPPLAYEITSGWSIVAGNAVVVSADSIASAVGVDVLRRGGNAVDAAVAVGFALAVTYPQAGNLGGGGFMLVRLESGETHFIDYRETAPSTATRDMYLDPLGNVIEGLSTNGHFAAGVPGTVAGMALAHRRFGSLPWPDLVSYARDLARDGFVTGEFLARSISAKRELLSSYAGSREVFIDPELSAGDVFVQSDLALTLTRIMNEGEKGFYEGRTAGLIAAEMERGRGLITKADLASYRPVFREPVRVRYRGYEIISAPLPSSGGVILSPLFQMLGRYDLAEMGYHSRAHVHLLTEAEKIVYRLRAVFLGDSDFFASPWRELTEPSYVDRLAGLIDLSRTLQVRELDALDLSPGGESGGAVSAGKSGGSSQVDESEETTPRDESEETTHFSIVDRWGNAVANTYTLNGAFGSGVTVVGAGFLLNNEMDDFSIKPGYPNLYGLVGSEANAIEPGKRMLSSMSPTIVLQGDTLFMVVGTPGGATIPTTVLQIISNVVDFKMPLDEAVAERRVHSQYLPDKVFFEAGALADPVVEALARLGHNVTLRGDIGNVQAVLIRNGRRQGDSESGGGGRLYGVSDPRGKGLAIGY